MKTNKFTDLVKRGLSVKSLMTLSESEIDKLHKLYEGKKEVCPKCGKEKCECKEMKKKETKEGISKKTETTSTDIVTATGDDAKRGVPAQGNSVVKLAPAGGALSLIHI